MELTKKELQEIRGGISGWVIGGIIAGIIFIIGTIDGFVRPEACPK